MRMVAVAAAFALIGPILEAAIGTTGAYLIVVPLAVAAFWWLARPSVEDAKASGAKATGAEPKAPARPAPSERRPSGKRVTPPKPKGRRTATPPPRRKAKTKRR
jgi:hypothetical protein